MKKALVIIAAIAGYAMLELSLLLSVILPQNRYSPGRYQIAVSWAQFLLIPGMAAVFSRVMYGSYQWRRRTLTILLAGSLGIPVAIILFAIPVLVLAWAADASMIFFWLVLPVVLGGMVPAVLFGVRKSGKWSVQAEAARWLAERQSDTTPRERAWRSRGIRFALCIPVLTALPVFLFLPETWGMLSHLGQRQLGNLSGYRVTIPAPWIILSSDGEQSDGRSWASGIAGKGIGLGGDPFRYDSLSYWEVGTKSSEQSEMTDYDRWPPKESEVLSRRAIAVGNESLACLDYWPSDAWAPPRSEAATIAHVTCGGNSRLHASFYGTRNQLPTFYRMLSGITPGR